MAGQPELPATCLTVIGSRHRLSNRAESSTAEVLIKNVPLPSSVAAAFGKSTLFGGLSETVTAAAYEASRRRDIGPGEYFCHQGRPAKVVYLVLEGKAKMTQVTADGQQVLVRFLDQGSCFGLVALRDGAEFQCTVEAVGACSALAWHREAFRDVLKRHPELALNALDVLTEQCQAWQRRYHEVTTQRVEQRIALTLLRLARQAGERVETGVLIDLPLTREDLADMTGTTLYTVSRVLNRWEQRGIVGLGRRRVVIRRRHGLVTIAEGTLDGEAAVDEPVAVEHL